LHEIAFGPPMTDMSQGRTRTRGRASGFEFSAQMPASPYLVYANWKITLQQAQHAQRSVRFFRRSFDHSLLWMIVMQGHYLHKPPMVQDCIAAVRASRMTVRRILADAQEHGFLEIRADRDSRRRKIVVPTALCIREYEIAVDRYFSLIRAFREHDQSGHSARAE
jgi:hypothetical protein